MKLLLIWPNSRNEVLGWGDLGAIAEPLALEYLAAGAVMDGHEVRILDLRLHPEGLAEVLSSFDPDVVGVTAFSMHVLRALAICEEVKHHDSGCVTVVGGHHAKFLPEDFFVSQVDYVVSGEGVAPLRRLLAELSESSPRSAIPGLWRRGDGDCFVADGDQGEIELAALPIPDRSLTAPDRSSYFIDWMTPVALVRTSVGCPFRCTFCSLWKMMDGRYYMRAVEQVVRELAAIEEPFVFLVDDEAFIHGRRMTELARALEAAGIRKRFFAYCRIDSLVREREAITAWQRVGLERLFIGVDAISNRHLQLYNKRYEVVKVEEAFSLADDLGIDIYAQFVVDPLYTKREFQRLVRFVEHNRIRYPSFTVLTPLPGTDLLRDFSSVTELQPNGRPNWDLFDCQNAVTRTALRLDEFRKEYRGLYHLFKGAYVQYREHSHLVEESSEGRRAELRRARVDVNTNY